MTPLTGPDNDVGVLLMAHGGSDAWNSAVAEAVTPISQRVPTAVAFGMADPLTLRASLDSLREEGVDRVAVVRMFISGQSFLDQTKYFLGLSESAPERLFLMGRSAQDPTAREPLRHGMEIVTHDDGLMVSPVVGDIVLERAMARSTDLGQESVLIIAHGMGDEGENDRVLEAMRVAAARVGEAGFGDVRVATLREDWAEARVEAERSLRDYVTRETASGRRVIVLPFRLSGFGPYAEVLQGLDYLPGESLLPHSRIADWVSAIATRTACSAGWGPIDRVCPVADDGTGLTRERRETRARR